MTQTNQTAFSTQQSSITYPVAKKAVESMNLINGFLFDSSIEDEEDAKIVIGAILTTVFNREINDLKVTSQKIIQPIDSKYHGIRLDAYVTEDKSGKISANIYDVEVEDREADKSSLPKRLRYYNSLSDSRLLESGNSYDTLPNYISVTILSYDPFNAGDIYYETTSVLKTHPNIPYKDGITHIYLYCNGKINDDLDASHGKKLMEVLKYIVSGEKVSSENKQVNDLEKVVSKIKKRPEVTKKYMQQWDRERHLVMDTKKEDALEVIRFGREDGVSDEKIRNRLETKFELDSNTINELFAKVDADKLYPNSK